MISHIDRGVLLACIAAVLLVVGAGGIRYYDSLPQSGSPIIAAAPTDQEWATELAGVAPPTSTSTRYRAPSSYTPTQAIAREFVTEYLAHKQDGEFTSSDAQAVLDTLVSQNARPVVPSTAYTVGAVKVSATAKYDTYAGALMEIISASDAIKEYELTTFSRSVGRDNYAGDTRLAAAAQVYRAIETNLTKMLVPTGVANEHVEFLQATANLAQATELLSKWSGDPILALSYIDAFVKSERQVDVSLNTLLARVIKLSKS